MSVGILEDIGGRWQLRFTRELAHPQEKVWRAVTQPEHMRGGVPQRGSGGWGGGGRPTFSRPGGAGPGLARGGLAYQPQSLGEVRWGDDGVRLGVAGP